MFASLPWESLPNARTKKLWQAAFRKEFPQSELEFNTGYVMPSEDWLKQALKSCTCRKNSSSWQHQTSSLYHIQSLSQTRQVLYMGCYKSRELVMSTCVRTREMEVRDGEWLAGWVRCMYILVWWAAAEVGGLEGELAVDGSCNPSAIYLKELALNIGSFAISPITVTTETYDPRCSFWQRR